MTGRETSGRERLIEAVTFLREDLARRGCFVELAICGGAALMRQFSWRLATEAVDAVVRQGYDERVLAPSVAARMGLSPDWLNTAVGLFTPPGEPDSLFALPGTYPPGDRPGLRVLAATPRCLLAMRLKALSSLDGGDRDLADATALASKLGLRDAEALHALDRSVHEEDANDAQQLRFRAILAGP